MINAFDAGSNCGAAYESGCGDHDNLEQIQESMNYSEETRNNFIQSLSTQQLPKEFIPKYRPKHVYGENILKIENDIVQGTYKF